MFAEADFPWWIAGGYAIELAVGRELRPHGDPDVLVLRRDEALVRDLLHDWDMRVVDPPGAGRLRPWRPVETLEVPLHDHLVQTHTSEAPWLVPLMLDEAEGAQWVTRRNTGVQLPLARLGRRSPTGITYLAPEVRLFYKTKATRDMEETDFEAVLPLLDESQRVGLARLIAMTVPAHLWRKRL
ncbi:nucleotidyltransferase domain-containing protein [Streptomyces sp. NPDC101145]|uniref:nucleotidyltransferase domain-containing protein n=1 Tax=Streptomyces sp. NPDC101145 TaxID=3366112 RepID=UPI00382D801E